MAGSDHISRREFVAWTSAVVGAFITAAVGLPVLDYLIAPALAIAFVFIVLVVVVTSWGRRYDRR